ACHWQVHAWAAVLSFIATTIKKAVTAVVTIRVGKNMLGCSIRQSVAVAGWKKRVATVVADTRNDKTGQNLTFEIIEVPAEVSNRADRFGYEHDAVAVSPVGKPSNPLGKKRRDRRAGQLIVAHRRVTNVR